MFFYFKIKASTFCVYQPTIEARFRKTKIKYLQIFTNYVQTMFVIKNLQITSVFFSIRASWRDVEGFPCFDVF